jgi:hypothetical protein
MGIDKDFPMDQTVEGFVEELRSAISDVNKILLRAGKYPGLELLFSQTDVTAYGDSGRVIQMGVVAKMIVEFKG